MSYIKKSLFFIFTIIAVSCSGSPGSKTAQKQLTSQNTKNVSAAKASSDSAANIGGLLVDNMANPTAAEEPSSDNIYRSDMYRSDMYRSDSTLSTDSFYKVMAGLGTNKLCTYKQDKNTGLFNCEANKIQDPFAEGAYIEFLYSSGTKIRYSNFKASTVKAQGCIGSGFEFNASIEYDEEFAKSNFSGDKADFVPNQGSFAGTSLIFATEVCRKQDTSSDNGEVSKITERKQFTISGKLIQRNEAGVTEAENTFNGVKIVESFSSTRGDETNAAGDIVEKLITGTIEDSVSGNTKILDSQVTSSITEAETGAQKNRHDVNETIRVEDGANWYVYEVNGSAEFETGENGEASKIVNSITGSVKYGDKSKELDSYQDLGQIRPAAQSSLDLEIVDLKGEVSQYHQVAGESFLPEMPEVPRFLKSEEVKSSFFSGNYSGVFLNGQLSELKIEDSQAGAKQIIGSIILKSEGDDKSSNDLVIDLSGVVDSSDETRASIVLTLPESISEDKTAEYQAEITEAGIRMTSTKDAEEELFYSTKINSSEGGDFSVKVDANPIKDNTDFSLNIQALKADGSARNFTGFVKLRAFYKIGNKLTKINLKPERTKLFKGKAKLNARILTDGRTLPSVFIQAYILDQYGQAQKVGNSRILKVINKSADATFIDYDMRENLTLDQPFEIKINLSDADGKAKALSGTAMMELDSLGLGVGFVLADAECKRAANASSAGSVPLNIENGSAKVKVKVCAPADMPDRSFDGAAPMIIVINSASLGLNSQKEIMVAPSPPANFAIQIKASGFGDNVPYNSGFTVVVNALKKNGKKDFSYSGRVNIAAELRNIDKQTEKQDVTLSVGHIDLLNGVGSQKGLRLELKEMPEKNLRLFLKGKDDLSFVEEITGESKGYNILFEPNALRVEPMILSTEDRSINSLFYGYPLKFKVSAVTTEFSSKGHLLSNLNTPVNIEYLSDSGFRINDKAQKSFLKRELKNGSLETQDLLFLPDSNLGSLDLAINIAIEFSELARLKVVSDTIYLRQPLPHSFAVESPEIKSEVIKAGERITGSVRALNASGETEKLFSGKGEVNILAIDKSGEKVLSASKAELNFKDGVALLSSKDDNFYLDSGVKAYDNAVLRVSVKRQDIAWNASSDKKIKVEAAVNTIAVTKRTQEGESRFFSNREFFLDYYFGGKSLPNGSKLALTFIDDNASSQSDISVNGQLVTAGVERSFPASGEKVSLTVNLVHTDSSTKYFKVRARVILPEGFYWADILNRSAETSIELKPTRPDMFRLIASQANPNSKRSYFYSKERLNLQIHALDKNGEIDTNFNGCAYLQAVSADGAKLKVRRTDDHNRTNNSRCPRGDLIADDNQFIVFVSGRADLNTSERRIVIDGNGENYEALKLEAIYPLDENVKSQSEALSFVSYPTILRSENQSLLDSHKVTLNLGFKANNTFKYRFIGSEDFIFTSQGNEIFRRVDSSTEIWRTEEMSFDGEVQSQIMVSGDIESLSSAKTKEEYQKLASGSGGEIVFWDPEITPKSGIVLEDCLSFGGKNGIKDADPNSKLNYCWKIDMKYGLPEPAELVFNWNGGNAGTVHRGEPLEIDIKALDKKGRTAFWIPEDDGKINSLSFEGKRSEEGQWQQLNYLTDDKDALALCQGKLSLSSLEEAADSCIKRLVKFDSIENYSQVKMKLTIKNSRGFIISGEKEFSYLGSAGLNTGVENPEFGDKVDIGVDLPQYVEGNYFFSALSPEKMALMEELSNISGKISEDELFSILASLPSEGSVDLSYKFTDISGKPLAEALIKSPDRDLLLIKKRKGALVKDFSMTLSSNTREAVNLSYVLLHFVKRDGSGSLDEDYPFLDKSDLLLNYKPIILSKVSKRYSSIEIAKWEISFDHLKKGYALGPDLSVKGKVRAIDQFGNVVKKINGPMYARLYDESNLGFVNDKGIELSFISGEAVLPGCSIEDANLSCDDAYLKNPCANSLDEIEDRLYHCGDNMKNISLALVEDMETKAVLSQSEKFHLVTNFYAEPEKAEKFLESLSVYFLEITDFENDSADLPVNITPIDYADNSELYEGAFMRYAALKRTKSSVKDDSGGDIQQGAYSGPDIPVKFKIKDISKRNITMNTMPFHFVVNFSYFSPNGEFIKNRQADNTSGARNENDVPDDVVNEEGELFAALDYGFGIQMVYPFPDEIKLDQSDLKNLNGKTFYESMNKDLNLTAFLKGDAYSESAIRNFSGFFVFEDISDASKRYLYNGQGTCAAKPFNQEAIFAQKMIIDHRVFMSSFIRIKPGAEYTHHFCMPPMEEPGAPAGNYGGYESWAEVSENMMILPEGNYNLKFVSVPFKGMGAESRFDWRDGRVFDLGVSIDFKKELYVSSRLALETKDRIVSSGLNISLPVKFDFYDSDLNKIDYVRNIRKVLVTSFKSQSEGYRTESGEYYRASICSDEGEGPCTFSSSWDNLINGQGLVDIYPRNTGIIKDLKVTIPEEGEESQSPYSYSELPALKNLPVHLQNNLLDELIILDSDSASDIINIENGTKESKAPVISLDFSKGLGGDDYQNTSPDIPSDFEVKLCLNDKEGKIKTQGITLTGEKDSLLVNLENREGCTYIPIVNGKSDNYSVLLEDYTKMEISLKNNWQENSVIEVDLELKPYIPEREIEISLLDRDTLSESSDFGNFVTRTLLLEAPSDISGKKFKIVPELINPEYEHRDNYDVYRDITFEALVQVDRNQDGQYDFMSDPYIDEEGYVFEFTGDTKAINLRARLKYPEGLYLYLSEYFDQKIKLKLFMIDEKGEESLIENKELGEVFEIHHMLPNSYRLLEDFTGVSVTNKRVELRLEPVFMGDDGNAVEIEAFNGEIDLTLSQKYYSALEGGYNYNISFCPADEDESCSLDWEINNSELIIERTFYSQGLIKNLEVTALRDYKAATRPALVLGSFSVIDPYYMNIEVTNGESSKSPNPKLRIETSIPESPDSSFSAELCLSNSSEGGVNKVTGPIKLGGKVIDFSNKEACLAVGFINGKLDELEFEGLEARASIKFKLKLNGNEVKTEEKEVAPFDPLEFMTLDLYDANGQTKVSDFGNFSDRIMKLSLPEAVTDRNIRIKPVLIKNSVHYYNHRSEKHEDFPMEILLQVDSNKNGVFEDSEFVDAKQGYLLSLSGDEAELKLRARLKYPENAQIHSIDSKGLAFKFELKEEKDKAQAFVYNDYSIGFLKPSGLKVLDLESNLFAAYEHADLKLGLLFRDDSGKEIVPPEDYSISIKYKISMDIHAKAASPGDNLIYPSFCGDQMESCDYEGVFTKDGYNGEPYLYTGLIKNAVFVLLDSNKNEVGNSLNLGDFGIVSRDRVVLTTLNGESRDSPNPAFNLDLAITDEISSTKATLCLKSTTAGSIRVADQNLDLSSGEKCYEQTFITGKTGDLLIEGLSKPSKIRFKIKANEKVLWGPVERSIKAYNPKDDLRVVLTDSDGLEVSDFGRFDLRILKLEFPEKVSGQFNIRGIPSWEYNDEKEYNYKLFAQDENGNLTEITEDGLNITLNNESSKEIGIRARKPYGDNKDIWFHDSNSAIFKSQEGIIVEDLESESRKRSIEDLEVRLLLPRNYSISDNMSGNLFYSNKDNLKIELRPVLKDSEGRIFEVEDFTGVFKVDLVYENKFNDSNSQPGFCHVSGGAIGTSCSDYWYFNQGLAEKSLAIYGHGIIEGLAAIPSPSSYFDFLGEEQEVEFSDADAFKSELLMGAEKVPAFATVQDSQVFIELIEPRGKSASNPEMAFNVNFNLPDFEKKFVYSVKIEEQSTEQVSAFELEGVNGTIESLSPTSKWKASQKTGDSLKTFKALSAKGEIINKLRNVKVSVISARGQTIKSETDYVARFLDYGVVLPNQAKVSIGNMASAYIHEVKWEEDKFNSSNTAVKLENHSPENITFEIWRGHSDLCYQTKYSIDDGQTWNDLPYEYVSHENNRLKLELAANAGKNIFFKVPDDRNDRLNGSCTIGVLAYPSDIEMTQSMRDYGETEKWKFQFTLSWIEEIRARIGFDADYNDHCLGFMIDMSRPLSEDYNLRTNCSQDSLTVGEDPGLKLENQAGSLNHLELTGMSLVKKDNPSLECSGYSLDPTNTTSASIIPGDSLDINVITPVSQEDKRDVNGESCVLKLNFANYSDMILPMKYDSYGKTYAR